ncbi:N-acetylmuramoyl-L-alanine amidase [Pseudomonas matsuisoli]|uniref:N-acetylmuramoyl-L-alanine amidase n=1 Tax=Pseudomonas matsuisoli TaxID=1515666 RepID=A0A917PWU7_9PSED|nr:N-acetylmuramoyl-L-alanine amidase [Pseudomonas matsuisoli]GGJ96012.1 protein AmpDh2 [Pseudomonas matsuisoli]
MTRFLPLALFLLLLAGCSSGPHIDKRYVSANHDSREQFIVLHYTSTGFEQSVKLLTHGEVSAHYLIDRDPARIYQLVDENRRAWHAGESTWNGRTWLNSSSIGIEMINPGYRLNEDGQRVWYPYADAQIDELIVLLKDIMQRHGLGPDAVVGHSDIAPQRKVDPGPLFPWKRLADAGLIRWPDAASVERAQAVYANGLPDATWFQGELAKFGYDVPRTGLFDEQTRNVIAAFQMRYRQQRYDGQADAETAALLWVLNNSRRS